MTTRRLFLAGAASLIAAPAIVRASSIMRVVMPKRHWLTAEDIRRLNVQRSVAMENIVRPPAIWSGDERGMVTLAPMDSKPYFVALDYLNETLARGYWVA